LPEGQGPDRTGTVSANAFRIDGLTPGRHTVKVFGDGLTTFYKTVTVDPGRAVDLGELTLEAAKGLTLEYAARTDGKFAAAFPKKVTLSGGGRWRVLPERNGFDLEFKQEKGGFVADYLTGPALVADLGEGKWVAFADVDRAKVTLADARGVAIKPGHVYLLHQRATGHWVLFRATYAP
jgi:hypothetical protein